MDIKCLLKSLSSHKVNRNLLAFGRIHSDTLKQALEIIEKLYVISKELQKLQQESTLDSEMIESKMQQVRMIVQFILFNTKYVFCLSYIVI